MRSAKAPTISAQVMAAKVAWKATKVSSGNDDALAEGGARSESGVMPFRKSLSKLPKNGLPPVKATL